MPKITFRFSESICSCYCCSFSSDDNRKLESHQKTYKVISDRNAANTSTLPTHKRYCINTPELLSCGIYGYETVHKQACDSRRCFKELISHQKWHYDQGHKCDHCGKIWEDSSCAEDASQNHSEMFYRLVQICRGSPKEEGEVYGQL